MSEASPSGSTIAIQRMPPQPITQSDVDFLCRSLPDLTVRRVSQVESRGIALLDRKPGVDDLKAKKAVERFLKKNKKNWIGVPVIRAGGVEQIPTNDFVVKFKPGITPAQAEEIIAAHGVEIIEHPTQYSPGLYVLRIPNSSAAKVLDLTKALSALPAVEFAQPDYILLFKHR